MDTKRTSMSVPEMGRWLGMGKTESYLIIRKFNLETIQVGSGTKKFTRVLMDSFEKWYAGQDRYKKVCEQCPAGSSFCHPTPDPRPEEEQIREVFGDRIVYSVEEASLFLCISKTVMYELVNLKVFPSEKVNNKILIPADLFHEWAERQTSFSLSEDYDIRREMMERFKGCFFNQQPGTCQPVNTMAQNSEADAEDNGVTENAGVVEKSAEKSESDEEADAALKLQQEHEEARIKALLEKIQAFNSSNRTLEDKLIDSQKEENAEVERKYYEVKEAAQLLNCSVGYIYKLIRKETIHSRKVAGRVLIFKDDFDTWYQAGGQ